MKTAIAMTLIVCGTLLILFPALYDLVTIRHLIEALPGTSEANLRWSSAQFLASPFRYLCWLMDAGMVWVVVLQQMRLPNLNTSAAQGRPVAA